MSPRLQVDQQRIDHFLQQLGRRFPKPGRVYLVGGTSLVYVCHNQPQTRCH